MNLTTPQLATAMEEWAAAVLSINTIKGSPTSLGESLPFVICTIQRDQRADRVPELPGIGNFQQTYVRARTTDLLLMVHPEPTDTATETLYTYVDSLGQAILDDPTLGARVHVASQFYDASYDPPEVQFPDGTVARAVTFTVTIGEVIGGAK
jgi:hypothetical protein